MAGSVPGLVFLAGDSIELFSGVRVNTIFGFMLSVLSIGAKWSEGVVELPAAGAVLELLLWTLTKVEGGCVGLGAGGVTFGSFHELPLPNSGRSIRSVLTKWDDSAADGGVVRNSLAWIYSNSNE